MLVAERKQRWLLVVAATLGCAGKRGGQLVPHLHVVDNSAEEIAFACLAERGGREVAIDDDQDARSGGHGMCSFHRSGFVDAALKLRSPRRPGFGW